ncbi:hypothetical protein [Cellulomonas endophytica]|uniref:hypothetical protein n=1 Tax=Cellulomonas endophytica TaxID=2494735 RepID=UPI00101023E0|nr:hypothetical protein [Cellulomonas endophytica]
MLMGLPDLGRPEVVGATAGFAVHERPGEVCAVPTSLRAEPLEVDQYLQERDGEVARFTVLSAAFTIEDDAGRPPRVRPAPLRSGRVRLVAPAAVGLPPDLLAPQPFDAATGAVLPTLVRLDGVAGDLLVGALRGGLQTLGAVVLVTVRGVAPRCPGTLTVDVDALLQDVGTAPVRPDDLLDRVADGLPGVSVTGGPADARGSAAAVVDRLVTRLAVPAFLDDATTTPRAGEGPTGHVDGTQGGWLFTPEPRTTLTWDLAEPVAAVRLVRLACDPVRGGSGPDAVVREHGVPPLTDGREPLVVHATMPVLPAGVLVATATLTAPPAPPARPFRAEVVAQLRPPAPAGATLRLAPGEPLVYDLTGAAVMDTDRGPRTIRGPARHVVGDPTPVVVPADLGLRLVAVHATRGLLDRADVTVTARASRWVRDPAVFVSVAALGVSGDGDAWLAVPRDAAEVTVQAVATTRGAHPRTVAQPLPDAAVWLDPFSFTDPPWAAEEEEDVLVVEAGGLRAVGPKGGSEWRFLPLQAGPVRTESGAPQLNLIEAGGLAMLMVTTALEVSDAAQTAVREAAVAAGAADDVRLQPAPFEVEGSAELLLVRDGQERSLAASAPSGTVSQDASFSVTLTADDLSVVHRALAGEPGLLTVRYLLRVAATGPLAESPSGGPGPVAVVTDAATWRA